MNGTPYIALAIMSVSVILLALQIRRQDRLIKRLMAALAAGKGE